MAAGKWIARWKKQIICVMGSLFIFAAVMYGESVDNPLSQGYLERGDYGEDGRSYEIIVEGVCQKPLSCTVEISSMQYREDEALKVMDELFLQLPHMILGENESLDQVASDLNLVKVFEGVGIRAVWQSKNPEVIDSYGQITAEEIDSDGIPAALSVTLTDGKYKKEGEINLRV